MLSADRAVVIQGRAAPVIVRVEQARRRADYKRQSRTSPAALPAPPHPAAAARGHARTARSSYRRDQAGGARRTDCPGL